MKTDKEKYTAKLNKYKLLLIALGVVTAVLSLTFASLRTDSNHALMYILTVLADVLYIWFLIASLSLVVFPMQRMLTLYNGNKSECHGKIVSVSENTTRMQGIDCKKVIIKAESERVIFLPDETIPLSAGGDVKLMLSSNIIVEAECDDK